MEFVSAYSTKRKNVLDFDPKEDRTKQSQKDECDINLIIKRYDKTGLVSHLAPHQPYFGEISSIDFQDAMNIVAEGMTAFEMLPSGLRNRFKNDPSRFLEFVGNEANREEAIKLGLIPAPEPVAEPVEAPEAPTPTPTTPVVEKGA